MFIILHKMTSMTSKKTLATHPDISLWHPSLNGTTNPCDIGLSSHKTFWFYCPVCEHDFQAIPHNAKKGIRCKFCIGEELCGKMGCTMCFTRSLASYQDLCCGAKNKEECQKKGCGCGIKKIDTMVKTDQYPISLHLNSNMHALFDCIKCHHQIRKVISQLKKGSWCAYCANQMLCGKETCITCFEKSLQSDPRVRFWDQKMNGDFNPITIFKGSSHTDYWWKCNTCNHNFEKNVHGVLNSDTECGCPYCASQLCESEQCNICYNRSFASDPRAESINHEKNKEYGKKIIARMCRKGSDDKSWFTCNNCRHHFDASFYHVSFSKSWCPYCCFPPLRLCNEENCSPCYEKSFASSSKVQNWNQSKNGDIHPRDVFKNCNSKFHFICKFKHEFEITPQNVTSGYWCGFCFNKTEQKLFDILQPFHLSLIRRFSPNWCRNPETGNLLPFDFVLEIHKIIIELDGPQHFRQISNWNSWEEVQKRDKIKEKLAEENGYSVIRILQEDVYNDTYDWVKYLNDSIKTIIEEGTVQNIYLAMNGEYASY